MSPLRSNTNPSRMAVAICRTSRIVNSPSPQLVASASTAEPEEALPLEEVSLTQVAEKELSPTFPLDLTVCRRAKRASSPGTQSVEGSAEHWSEDENETYKDYKSRLVAAKLEIERLRTALMHEQDRNPFIGRLSAPQFCKDKGTQVDRETKEQGAQVEVEEDDNRMEQRP
ncbi:hypothetical protein BGZ54_002541, partial [Gamsiella multidivaricata]